MRILGIDPGLQTTGYGVVDFEAGKIKLIEAGIIKPNPKDLLQSRLHKVHENLDALLIQHNPHVMILEKLYSHYKHPNTACILGHVRGVICLLCAQRSIELVEYAVKRIRKAITGNGNAQKLQTRSVIANIFKVDETRLTLDASDALALALGHTYISKGFGLSGSGNGMFSRRIKRSKSSLRILNLLALRKSKWTNKVHALSV